MSAVLEPALTAGVCLSATLDLMKAFQSASGSRHCFSASSAQSWLSHWITLNVCHAPVIVLCRLSVLQVSHAKGCREHGQPHHMVLLPQSLRACSGIRYRSCMGAIMMQTCGAFKAQCCPHACSPTHQQSLLFCTTYAEQGQDLTADPAQSLWLCSYGTTVLQYALDLTLCHRLQ